MELQKSCRAASIWSLTGHWLISWRFGIIHRRRARSQQYASCRQRLVQGNLLFVAVEIWFEDRFAIASFMYSQLHWSLVVVFVLVPVWICRKQRVWFAFLLLVVQLFKKILSHTWSEVGDGTKIICTSSHGAEDRNYYSCILWSVECILMYWWASLGLHRSRSQKSYFEGPVEKSTECSQGAKNNGLYPGAGKQSNVLVVL